MDMPVRQQVALIDALGARSRCRTGDQDPRLRPQLVRAPRRHRDAPAGEQPETEYPYRRCAPAAGCAGSRGPRTTAMAATRAGRPSCTTLSRQGDLVHRVLRLARADRPARSGVLRHPEVAQPQPGARGHAQLGQDRRQLEPRARPRRRSAQRWLRHLYRRRHGRSWQHRDEKRRVLHARAPGPLRAARRPAHREHVVRHDRLERRDHGRAFRNPDGSTALVVHNENDDPRTFAVAQGGRSFDYTLPGGALATFAWPPRAALTTARRLLDRRRERPASRARPTRQTRRRRRHHTWSTGATQQPGQCLQVDLGAVDEVRRVVLDTGDRRGRLPARMRAVTQCRRRALGEPVAHRHGAGQLTTVDLPATRAALPAHRPDRFRPDRLVRRRPARLLRSPEQGAAAVTRPVHRHTPTARPRRRSSTAVSRPGRDGHGPRQPRHAAADTPRVPGRAPAGARARVATCCPDDAGREDRPDDPDRAVPGVRRRPHRSRPGSSARSCPAAGRRRREHPRGLGRHGRQVPGRRAADPAADPAAVRHRLGARPRQPARRDGLPAQHRARRHPRPAAGARRSQHVTAEETRATGPQWAFAPCLCVARDDRWGRTYESFSENPALVKKFETAIDGLQGRRRRPDATRPGARHRQALRG